MWFFARSLDDRHRYNKRCGLLGRTFGGSVSYKFRNVATFPGNTIIFFDDEPRTPAYASGLKQSSIIQQSFFPVWWLQFFHCLGPIVIRLLGKFEEFVHHYH